MNQGTSYGPGAALATSGHLNVQSDMPISTGRDSPRELAIPRALGNVTFLIERLAGVTGDLTNRLELAGVLRPPAPQNEKSGSATPCACGLQATLDEKAMHLTQIGTALQQLIDRLEV